MNHTVRMRWVITLVAGTGLCVAGGCATYRPQPLTAAAVEQRLTLADEDTLRVAAASLRHPTLRPVTLDLARGLSPDEAAVLAVIANPDLRAQRDRRAAAAAQVLQAGLLPNPQLSGNVDVPVDAPPDSNFTAYGVGLEWEVTSLITRDARRRAAAADADSVDLDIAWQEWQVAEAAKTAALDVLALESQLTLARQIEQQFDQNVRVLQDAVQRHERTMLDLSAAEVSAQDAHQVALATAGALGLARLVLNRALGFPADLPVKLRPIDLPWRLDPPGFNTLLDDLEGRRLDLLALKKGYESQDATLRAAILGQFPKISLGLSQARDTSNVRTIGLGVSIDIPLFDRNQGVIGAETATRRRLFDEYVSRVFAARADIAAAIEEIRSTGTQIDAAQAAIPGLERLVGTYGRALEQGNADILSYYTAQATLAQKRIDIVKLKQQLVQSWVALELAAGEYLPWQPAVATTRPAASQPVRPEGAP